MLLICVDYMKFIVSNKTNATSNTVNVNTSSIATTNATTTASMVTTPPAVIATPVETTGIQNPCKAMYVYNHDIP